MLFLLLPTTNTCPLLSATITSYARPLPLLLPLFLASRSAARTRLEHDLTQLEHVAFKLCQVAFKLCQVAFLFASSRVCVALRVPLASCFAHVAVAIKVAIAIVPRVAEVVVVVVVVVVMIVVVAAVIVVASS